MKLKSPKLVKKKTAKNMQYSFLSNFEFTPPQPPKALGFIEKMGSWIFNFNNRFIEVDPVMGAYRRYKQKSDYPSNPV